MSNRNLTDNELNAISEVLNISTSSAAVAISTILNKQINIKVSKTMMQDIGEINLVGYDDGLVIACSYKSGLLGRFAILIRKIDIQTILNLLMNSENDDINDFTFDEFSLSTINEIANQMLNSGSSSLSEFFSIRIETDSPQTKVFEGRGLISETLDIDDGEKLLYATLKLDINGLLSSDLILLFSFDAADAINKLMSYNKEVKSEQNTSEEKQVKEPANIKKPEYNQTQNLRDEITVDSRLNLNKPASTSGRIRNPGVKVQETQFPNFSEGVDNSTFNLPLLKNNMDLLMNVQLDVSIELGKTKIKMKNVLDFAQGTIINLEKQAGAPVDVVVNGQLIARGDVVVIDDNFGVRITEIIEDSNFLLNKKY